MKKMNLKKGFTLIELLVVVAIIAILVGVVLISVNTARNKGNDAGVKTNLHTVTNQAELFYIDNNNSYLPAGGSVFSIATCPVYNASGTNMLSVNKVIADAIAQAVKTGNGSSCYNSTSAWAVAVGLKLTPNTSWCVDNTGTSKQVASDPSTAINTSTFMCN
jgi:prepilin-type N-terminal cleavage/methylation domain-containing protein